MGSLGHNLFATYLDSSAIVPASTALLDTHLMTQSHAAESAQKVDCYELKQPPERIPPIVLTTLSPPQLCTHLDSASDSRARICPNSGSRASLSYRGR